MDIYAREAEASIYDKLLDELADGAALNGLLYDIGENYGRTMRTLIEKRIAHALLDGRPWPLRDQAERERSKDEYAAGPHPPKPGDGTDEIVGNVVRFER